MKSKLSVLYFLVILVVALGSAAVACGGGGQLSLEEYLQRLEAARDDASQRSEELAEESDEERDAASTDEEWLDATLGLWDGFAPILDDFIDDLRGLNPPAEAEGPHNDLGNAELDVLELIKQLIDQLEDTESRSEAEAIEEQFQEDVDEISERVDGALCALQDLADENGIDVDLECEARQATPPDEEARPTPTEVTEVGPTATATAAAGAPDVQVLNYGSHQSEFGSLNFFGEVINNGDGDAANVQVILTLTDSAGNVVGTGSAFVDVPAILEPAGKAPFIILVIDPPAEWANETLQVTAEEPGQFIFGNTYTDLEVSGVTVTPGEFGGLTIRGQVTNVGSEDAELVEVVFVARDTDGTVLWADFTFVDIDPLQPGIAGPFEILAFDFDEIPPGFDVVAAGSTP